MMELLIIGNEVLKGEVVNTNFSFMAQELFKEGYLLAQETVVPDNEERLIAAFKEALSRSSLVIASGGLGPTLDDVTRKAAAACFGLSFQKDPQVAQNLVERFGTNLPTLEDQAWIPEGSKPLLNPVGTAPGLIFEREKSTLILLPGVPHEMRALFQEQVLPYIKKHFPLKAKTYRKRLSFFELSEHTVDAVLRTLKERYPLVDFGIYPGIGTVAVTLSVQASQLEEAERWLQEPYIELEKAFASNCFLSNTLEEAVQALFTEKGWTLSVAESCTGGALSTRLIQLPGASRYFLGAVTPYSNRLKTELLGVPASLIQEKGAVSREVVAMMAEGVLKVTGSDFALAVSGVAGPEGGTLEKPVGTVCCAVIHRESPPHTWTFQFPKTRSLIITRSVNSLLAHLLLYTKSYNV